VNEKAEPDVSKLVGALENIDEYWNRDQSVEAMQALYDFHLVGERR